ncbi:MAG: BamA/TamA family outer membrane protein [Candidatus Eiseniibacteriota bacterium]
MGPSRTLAVLALLVLRFDAPGPVWAQNSSAVTPVDPAAWTTPAIDPAEDLGGEAAATSPSRVTPIAAPIPFKNSQLGWGLAVMVGAIHRFDPDTTIKPSTGAVAGFYSENHSWGVVAMELARLKHDAWRLRGVLSHCELNYDFYGIGEDAGNAGVNVGIAQTMDFAVAAGLRRFAPGLYLGASAAWLRTTAKLRDPLPAGLPEPGTDLSTAELVAPGFVAELDTRDDDYWPHRGSLVNLKSSFFTGALGSSKDFQRHSISWSWYTRLGGEAVVLATNVNAAAAKGDAPFYTLPSIGSGVAGLRGYQQGRYRDDLMTTAQAEVRLHSKGRWGATAFGGFGQVAPGVGDLGSAEVLPAGGLGLRFQLTNAYPMHMRADYAWGKNGGIGYFSVAEAF